jgi:PAS domain S-box-containing protein
MNTEDDTRLERLFRESRAAKDKLDIALQAGGIGIWEYDLVAHKIHFDRAWLEYLGYADLADATMSPEWWDERSNPADYAALKKAFLAHIAGTTPAYKAEHRQRTADGRWIWLLSTGRISERDSKGVPIRFVGTSIDITERKALQERVAFSERMASIGTLAAGVAHEINNPLTFVLLNLALLERNVNALGAGAPAEIVTKLRNMVEQARYGCERVSSVVHDLQTLTRVNEQADVPIDVNAVLERCFEMASHQLQGRAKLVRELTGLPPIRASEHRVGQLFLNLIMNAAQAIPEGAADSNTVPEGAADSNTVRVATRVETDGRILVEVADTGIGIPAAVIGRIFDPFFTTKPVGEGSGIGLSICRSIVTALGGEITVESQQGTGTRFRVLLPPGAEQAGPVLMPPAPRELASRLRVLVIDDEPLIGQVITSLLAGHLVVSEISARMALDRLQRGESFDWILCDLMMPEMTGMDLYDALEAAVQERVIFITGGLYSDRAREFLQRVPNRRLFKPFDVETLLAALS